MIPEINSGVKIYEAYSWSYIVCECGSCSHCCAPDLSCCYPKLQWDAARRKSFYKATPDVKQTMMLTQIAAITKQFPADKSKILSTMPLVN